MNYKKVNWNAVDERRRELGYSKRDLSCIMGKGVNWFSQASHDKRGILDVHITQLALILKCEETDILETVDWSSYKEPEQSQFEVDVLEMLRAIKQKVDSDHEIMLMLFNEKQQENKQEQEQKNQKSELEIAMFVLKDLLKDRQAIKAEEYYAKAKETGCQNDKIIDSVIAKLGCEKHTRGYGNNKTTWIYKGSQGW